MYNGLCVWYFEFFFGFTERLTDRYPDLFTGDVEDGGEKRISATDGFGEKWSGYHTIAVLAGNDIAKFEEVTRLNIHECLTFLAYKKDLSAMELAQAKAGSK
jgi:hypothetical protein